MKVEVLYCTDAGFEIRVTVDREGYEDVGIFEYDRSGDLLKEVYMEEDIRRYFR